MKKLNQKSINKIIFCKLFENTNDTFQDVRIDSSKVSDVSMGMNSLPLKSDTPTRSPEHEEWEEYDEWLEKQLEEWERSHPAPVWTDDMTLEEYNILIEDWLFERSIETDRLQQWYERNTGFRPRPDPKPKPRQRTPTWSPAPPWVPQPPPPPPNNPNWWHWGPDGSDRPI